MVQNDPDAPPARLGEWLTEAGLNLTVVQPYADQQPPDPDALDGYAALVVLGGRQRAYPGPDGTPDAPWLPAVEALLRRAVRRRLPTLAVGLGAQLLATAHGGTVAPAVAGPEIGAALVAKRDIAVTDPLFADVPLLPDVIQWHHDEITELPAQAVLLAASTRCPHQAFRVGPVAWGVQFHIEADISLVARWAERDAEVLARLGRSPDDVLATVAAVLPETTDVWRPFTARFVALVRGEISDRTNLPLLDE